MFRNRSLKPPKTPTRPIEHLIASYTMIIIMLILLIFLIAAVSIELTADAYVITTRALHIQAQPTPVIIYVYPAPEH
jgi:hypothetical protein